MKRFLSLLLAVVMAVGILTIAPVQITVSAAGTDGLKFSYYKATDSYYVSGCADTVSGEVVIPAKHNNKPVTFIASYVFENKNNITSVVIPDTVTTIGEMAFYGCKNLQTVHFGNGLTSIGELAFTNTGLISATFANPYGWTPDILEMTPEEIASELKNQSSVWSK